MFGVLFHLCLLEFVCGLSVQVSMGLFDSMSLHHKRTMLKKLVASKPAIIPATVPYHFVPYKRENASWVCPLHMSNLDWNLGVTGSLKCKWFTTADHKGASGSDSLNNVCFLK